MKELIEHIAQALVDHPDDVHVEEVEEDNGVVIELQVNDEDLGKVIGRRGRTASAMRALLSASATKRDTKASLEILE